MLCFIRMKPLGLREQGSPGIRNVNEIGEGEHVAVLAIPEDQRDSDFSRDTYVQPTLTSQTYRESVTPERNISDGGQGLERPILPSTDETIPISNTTTTFCMRDGVLGTMFDCGAAWASSWGGARLGRKQVIRCAIQTSLLKVWLELQPKVLFGHPVTPTVEQWDIPKALKGVHGNRMLELD
jgi:hypothetical protein